MNFFKGCVLSTISFTHNLINRLINKSQCPYAFLVETEGGNKQEESCAELRHLEKSLKCEINNCSLVFLVICALCPQNQASVHFKYLLMCL